MVLLFAVLLALATVIAYRPAADYFQKRILSQSSSRLQSTSAIKMQNFLEESPFLAGLKSHLQQQSIAQGEQPQILLIRTVKLNHPTPHFRFYFNIPAGEHKVTGYGFRVYRHGKRIAYEPLKASYLSKGSVSLKWLGLKPETSFCFSGELLLLRLRRNWPILRSTLKRKLTNEHPPLDLPCIRIAVRGDSNRPRHSSVRHCNRPKGATNRRRDGGHLRA